MATALVSRNTKSLNSLKAEQSASVNIIKSPKTGKLFFECGSVKGYISKKAREAINVGASASDLQYMEVQNSEGTWIPTICPVSKDNVVATL